MNYRRRHIRPWFEHEETTDQDWVNDCQRAAATEMAAFDKLNPDVKKAVLETGFMSTEALRYQQRIGDTRAIIKIMDCYKKGITCV